MVPVGDVIITFDTDEQSSSGGRPSADDVEGEAVQEDPTEAEAAVADESSSGEAAGGEAPGDGTASAGTETADAGEVTETEGRVFAAPSARRVARELGVDIGSVDGSGPGGRVTEGDVQVAAESDNGATPAAADAESDAGVESATERVTEESDADGATASAVESADRERTLAAPATRKLADEEGVDLDAVPTDERRDGEAFVAAEHVEQYAEAQQAAQAADAEAVSAGAGEGGIEAASAAEDERVPYRGVRKTIGEQMERSKYTAPHVTHHDQADVTGLVEARGRLKNHAEERGTKLTYMPFVVKAIVAALKEHPVLNSQLDEDNEEIVLKNDYNIGVATATDAGLMVPVVEGTDRKGMLEIADEMRELIESARDRSIARSDMQGGTFTITNFGAIGGEYATPVINYPETAILGLGAIKDRPWVVDGEVEAREVMTLSLSIDHRVIDGADAAQFVNTVKEYLENPELLLLE